MAEKFDVFFRVKPLLSNVTGPSVDAAKVGIRNIFKKKLVMHEANVCLSDRLSDRLSVGLSVRVSVCLSVCPLIIYAMFTFWTSGQSKFCKKEREKIVQLEMEPIIKM